MAATPAPARVQRIPAPMSGQRPGSGIVLSGHCGLLWKRCGQAFPPCGAGPARAYGGKVSDFRILVAGAGATGGFFGGRLLQAGRDVTFLVRPGRAKQLRDRGLRITGLGEDTVLAPELVEAGDIAGTYDLVLFTVKAAGIAQAIEDI